MPPKSCIVLSLPNIILVLINKTPLKPVLCLCSGYCAWVQFQLLASFCDIFSPWDISILKAVVVQRYLDVVNCCFPSSMSYSNMPNCQTVVGPRISHGLNSWGGGFGFREWSMVLLEPSSHIQSRWLWLDSHGGQFQQVHFLSLCLDGKHRLLHDGLLLYTGDCHDEKNLFLKLMPVQYGDCGRFPYRGGPLPGHG